MKKIVPYILMFVIIFGVFAPIATVYGQSDDNIVSTQKVTVTPYVEFNCAGIFGPNPTCWLAQLSLASLKIIGGYSLFASGTLLNLTIQETILKANTFFDSDGIKTSWGIIRDLANIFFIFILLAIGITTILQVPNWETKRLLRDLIIMALLVNFSFFFTMTVIDISNVMSTEIFQEIQVGDGECSSETSWSKCLSYGFTGEFMEQLKLKTLFNPENIIKETYGGGPTVPEAFYGKIITIGFFGTIFLLITAFSFLVTAIMLIIRVVILTLLLVVSPLALAAYVLTYTRQYFKTWLKHLFSNAFFAPVYLMAIFISLTIMREIGARNISGDPNDLPTFAGALLEGDSSKVDIFLHFALMSGFIIASLYIAKQMGAVGASKVTGIGNVMRKGVQGAFFRQTLGRASAGAAYVARKVEGVGVPGAQYIARPLERGAELKFGTDKGYKQAKEDRVKQIRGRKQRISDEKLIKPDEERRRRFEGPAITAGQEARKDIAKEEVEKAKTQQREGEEGLIREERLKAFKKEGQPSTTEEIRDVEGKQPIVLKEGTEIDSVHRKGGLIDQATDESWNEGRVSTVSPDFGKHNLDGLTKIVVDKGGEEVAELKRLNQEITKLTRMGRKEKGQLKTISDNERQRNNILRRNIDSTDGEKIKNILEEKLKKGKAEKDNTKKILGRKASTKLDGVNTHTKKEIKKLNTSIQKIKNNQQNG